MFDCGRKEEKGSRKRVDICRAGAQRSQRAMWRKAEERRGLRETRYITSVRGAGKAEGGDGVPPGGILVAGRVRCFGDGFRFGGREKEGERFFARTGRRGLGAGLWL